jgi:DNA ligase-1
VHRWSELAERVASTTRTSEKTSLLAAYLPTLEPAELRIASVFLSGRPFPEADQRSTGLGWATIAGVVAAVAGTPAGALGAAYDRSSDLGMAVFDVLTNAGHLGAPDGGPSILEVAEAYTAIEAASGPARKGAIFQALLTRADPLAAKYIVKVLTGELRIGLREGLLEAAIARAFDRPLDRVKWAGMLTGDVGRTAVLAQEDRLEDAQLALFHPLKFMLASPAEDAAEILTRLGPTVWVEDKYDGIRAQLHRAGSSVKLFSRDLHDVSNQFPEIVFGARDCDWEGILDGELLAYRDGQVLPFLALQTRLGRKAPSAAIRAKVPVIFVAFDLLAYAPRDRGAATAADPVANRAAGEPPEVPSAFDEAPLVEPLLTRPLSERRRLLEGLGLPLVEDGGVFALSNLITATSTDDLETVFEAARARRNEGLMVKDPSSGYSPGRRGLGWLKMKKALATIDCVVVGVEVGHGKRHGVLSDYTFAVRDDATGELVTIGKAYSGLTDAEIAEMTRWFEAHTIRQLGRYRVVEPTVVVEVAFDVIMRSSRHKSGFALRFPRIAHLRTDKPPDEIDTLATVQRLYDGLQQGAEHLVTAGARAATAAAGAATAAAGTATNNGAATVTATSGAADGHMAMARDPK